MLMYPENYPSKFSGRVFISEIKFNIFWALLDDNNNIKENDIKTDFAIIKTLNEKYVYDTTWKKHKIEPYNKLEDNLSIDLLDSNKIEYKIMNNGNNKIIHKFNFPKIKDSKQYIIITTDIQLENVYPMNTNMDDIQISYKKKKK